MPVTPTNVRNLNDSRVQVLQALQSVSEGIADIFGDANLPGDGTRRNESGDLVNEEGLPIIDITEPLDELDTPSLSAATEEDVIEEDNYPEPISKLSPEALVISRKHRDKILDLLEQEEEREALKTHQERQLELTRKREAARVEMQKRMLTQGMDLEKRRQAKELEKKMAKALVSGLGEHETAKVKTHAEHSGSKKKKVVTFADPPSADSETVSKVNQEKMTNWGDVVPAQFPPRKARLESSRTQPMKMEVIERKSPRQSSNVASTPQLHPNVEHSESTRDSDDESDLEAASDTTIPESEVEDVLSAQHHRDLALEYHRRREALASSAGTLVMHGGLPDDHGHDAKSWNEEEVPLDATLAHPPPKPTISKFKASRIKQDDSQVPVPVTQTSQSPRVPTGPSRSATFGTSVLSADALSKSIKLGKLVDGQLVAGPHDEDAIDGEDKEEAEIRKLLLKSMEEYSGIAAQLMGAGAKDSYWGKDPK